MSASEHSFPGGAHVSHGAAPAARNGEGRPSSRLRLLESLVLLGAALLLGVATVNDVVRQTHINHRLVADLRTWRTYTGHDYRRLSASQDFRHHTTREVVCLDCGERAPMERALARVRAGEADPPCRTCGGILKSATISFGQGLVQEDLQRAGDAARRCDLMLAIGTKLSVYPIAGVVPVAKEAGARVVIVNAEPTEMDSLADAVLRGSISALLPRLV